MVKENSVKKESGSFLVRQRETLGKTGSHTSLIRARVETSLRSELMYTARFQDSHFFAIVYVGHATTPCMHTITT